MSTGARPRKMGACTHRPAARWVQAPILLCFTATLATAEIADAAGQAFADHCFSPFLTAQKAQDALSPSGARVDFYDLRPFSGAAPSPVTGRAATPGTDRRCEVAFDGDAVTDAFEWVNKGLTQERLANRIIPVPQGFARMQGATNTAAVQLNPKRIAVVQVGTRQGPNGVETFITLERLDPLEDTGS